MAKQWMFVPGSGGVAIPKHQQETIRQRILAHANKNYAGKFNRIDVRFRGKHCYIDAYIEPEDPGKKFVSFAGETREEYMERLRNNPLHLCRLLYYSTERWGLSFYTYSNEKYEVSMYPNGTFYGTLEEGFDVGAIYLD
jgi:hypothetical protein